MRKVSPGAHVRVISISRLPSFAYIFFRCLAPPHAMCTKNLMGARGGESAQIYREGGVELLFFGYRVTEMVLLAGFG